MSAPSPYAPGWNVMRCDRCGERMHESEFAWVPLVGWLCGECQSGLASATASVVVVPEVSAS